MAYSLIVPHCELHLETIVHLKSNSTAIKPMNAFSLPNYFRMFRRRTGLTQNEVAFLLGSKSGSQVSRYEQRKQTPNLQTTLAYEVLFQTPVRKLQQGTFVEIEQEVRKRAGTLASRLSKGSMNRKLSRKIEFLKAVNEGRLSVIVTAT